MRQYRVSVSTSIFLATAKASVRGIFAEFTSVKRRQLNSNFLATAKASVRGIFAEFTSVKRRQLNSNFLATAKASVARNLRGASLILKGRVK